MSAVVQPQSSPRSAGPRAPHPAALNAAAASFAALTDRLDYLSPEDVEQVRRAYRFADEAHLGQLRNSGEPYITHPIAVAAQCAEWKLDAQALMARANDFQAKREAREKQEKWMTFPEDGEGIGPTTGV